MADQTVVLVLEDDAGIRALVSALLRRIQVTAEMAINGAEALSMLAAKPYAALVVDIMTPLVSGADFLREVELSRPEMLNRTVVMTALAESQIHQMVGRMPRLRVPILRKPFEITAFLSRMEDALNYSDSSAMQDLREIADRFEQDSIALGASGGVLAVIHPIDGSMLDMESSYGYPAGMAELFFPLPLDRRFPLSAAARQGAPVWLGSPKAAGEDYPELPGIWQKTGSHALASVPIFHQGKVVGVAGWSFKDPQDFDETQRATITRKANEYGEILSNQRSAEASEGKNKVAEGAVEG